MCVRGTFKLTNIEREIDKRWPQHFLGCQFSFIFTPPPPSLVSAFFFLLMTDFSPPRTESS